MNAVVQDRQKRSPLEQPVADILANPQYLSREHAEKLLGMIRMNFPGMMDSDDKTQQISLRDQLKKMGEQIQRMLNSAAAGESTDMKRVFDAQKEYFKLFAKYNDTLKANTRMQAIENATIEAFTDLPDSGVKDRFLEIFRLKLEESTKNQTE